MSPRPEADDAIVPGPQPAPAPAGLNPDEVYAHLQELLLDARNLSSQGKDAEAAELYDEIRGLEEGIQ